MTEDEKRKHALRIAAEAIAYLEYSDVYGDEYLEDASEADWDDIRRIITHEVKVSL